MKKLLPILLCFFLVFGCNFGNNQGEEKPLLLDFPSISTYADSIIYSGCDDIISMIPTSFNFEIYEDTIIDLYQINNRMNLKLKFNWKYEDYWDIGVTSIDVIYEEEIVSSIDLVGVITVEAFPQKNAKTGRHMETVREDIYMQDVNLDSYLDIKVRSTCGKGCYYSYWIFNPKKHIFEMDKSLSSMRPYYVDCKNNLIYSYEGGTAWYYDSRAYKVTNGKVELFQSVYYEYNTNYNLEIYRDASGSIIFADTTLK